MKIHMGGKVNTNTTVNVYFKYLVPDSQYLYSTSFTWKLSLTFSQQEKNEHKRMRSYKSSLPPKSVTETSVLKVSFT